jgi:transcriptional regulator with XRE-family HTH domain
MKTYLLEDETKARDHDSLGSNISVIRNSLGLSQRELAKLIGISNSTLSEIELDIRVPNPETLYKISKALKCDYMYLMMVSGYIEYQPALNILLKLFHKLSDNDIEKLMNITQDLFLEQYESLYID